MPGKPSHPPLAPASHPGGAGAAASPPLPSPERAAAPRITVACLPVAGLATRLGPAAGGRPKCLLEFGGQTLLDRAIELLTACGVETFALVVGHLREQILEHLGRRHAGLAYEVFVQERQTGLVDALDTARPALEGRPFALLCPDNYFADSWDLARCFRAWAPGLRSAIVARWDDSPERNRGLLRGDFSGSAGDPVRLTAIEPSTGPGWISTGFSLEGETFFESAARVRARQNERRLFDVWREALAGGGELLAQPLMGLLFDVTTPSDAAELRHRFENLPRGVAVILQDDSGRCLLALRDDKPQIRYPGYWALFGGTVEPGEEPEAGACRELAEELELQLSPEQLEPVCSYVGNLKQEFVYAARLDRPLASLRLREGQRMALFDREELAALRIRDDDRVALERYLRRQEAQTR